MVYLEAAHDLCSVKKGGLKWELKFLTAGI
ncbi:hypothetical protein BTT_34030 [Bacillus thuringiensis serovar morrisoni str. 4AA1]|nr:hypothetical protein IAW_01745 [Bacillus cereus str. Schrouff]EOO87484.1 hypothetical protein IGY_02363 [Bacillus cereus K-5975c]KIP28381.1 hypothetical protein BG10_6742 [Bacillus thuringiensis serovar morrisoni]UOC02205.1 hypothetical protein BTT_34030 [Bacillus thuringiensis serovar morrisoni str. 4AA1]SPT77418.1 Uncharacterised protein [Bacillus cereus]